MRRTTLHVALAALCMIAAAACASVLGFEQLTEAPKDAGPAPDAGIDVRSPPPVDPACDQLGLPPRPEGILDPSGPDLEMAFKSLDLGITYPEAGVLPPTGYNLDRRCTTTIEESSCTTGKLNEIEQRNVLDPPDSGGLDNQAIALIRGTSAGTNGVFSPENINDQLVKGHYGATLKITNYNGKADDSEVAVEFFPALGVFDPTTSLRKEPPNHDETDEWALDLRYENQGRSTFRTPTAYVAKNILVASFSELEITVLLTPSRAVPLHLYGAIITGELVREDGGVGFHLTKGIVTGRLTTAGFLSSIGLLKDPLDIDLVCKNDTLMKLVRDPVCVARDLAADPAADLTRQDEFKGGKRAPCAAISTGARFESYYVKKTRADRTLDASAVPTGDAAACLAGFAECERDQ